MEWKNAQEFEELDEFRKEVEHLEYCKKGRGVRRMQKRSRAKKNAKDVEH